MPFYVLFEELIHDGEFIGYGDILAAEFVNNGQPYRAIQYAAEGPSARLLCTIG